jgi:peptide/nickel transport system ATP-binding protein
LDNLRLDLKMAMLLITHDMGVIAGRTDRVVVMYAGKKAEEATTETLFTAMRHPYTQALLASMPSMENTSKHELSSIAGMPPNLANEIVGCRFAPRCVSATDRCRQEDPPLVVGGAHEFACFHPTSGPQPIVVYSTATVNEAAPRKELLRAQGLVKEFDIKGGVVRHKVGAIHAVSDVSFTLYEGETFGLVGESGCGKTTIGRMLVGLETLTAGEVYFDSELVTAKGHKPTRQSRRDRQMMFQDPYASLDPRMKVAQILGEPLAIQKVGSKGEQAVSTPRSLIATPTNSPVASASALDLHGRWHSTLASSSPTNRCPRSTSRCKRKS